MCSVLFLSFVLGTAVAALRARRFNRGFGVSLSLRKRQDEAGTLDVSPGIPSAVVAALPNGVEGWRRELYKGACCE